MKFQYEDMTRFFAFCLVLDQIVKDKVSGDFAELGVWKGYSAAFLATISRRLGRKIYLLDTYEGFDEKDLSSNEKHLRGAFSDTSLKAVRDRVGEQDTVFIKGYFPDTASQIPNNSKFSLVHIDCDLEAPMRAALEYFYPRMQPGGFILMHDYSSLFWDGTQRTIDEFFSNKPECVVPLPDLAGTAVIRRNKSI